MKKKIEKSKYRKIYIVYKIYQHIKNIEKKK